MNDKCSVCTTFLWENGICPQCWTPVFLPVISTTPKIITSTTTIEFFQEMGINLNFSKAIIAEKVDESNETAQKGLEAFIVGTQ